MQTGSSEIFRSVRLQFRDGYQQGIRASFTADDERTDPDETGSAALQEERVCYGLPGAGTFFIAGSLSTLRAHLYIFWPGSCRISAHRGQI